MNQPLIANIHLSISINFCLPLKSLVDDSLTAINPIVDLLQTIVNDPQTTISHLPPVLPLIDPSYLFVGRKAS